MNTNSNTYTFIYASILVVVVAAALAFVSEVLKPIQQSNIESEKRLNILRSAHLALELNGVSNRNSYVADMFNKYVTNSYCVDNDPKLPVYECTLDDGSTVYVVEVSGQGLWGPIWGFISLKDDMNTIYGAVFDHKGETPGLGAEISTKEFARQFEGKTIFDNNRFISISVVKGGAKPGDNHAVDAISGGTITSNALQEMLYNSLEAYIPFFNSKTHQ
ncbi:MAG: NADH:ubiquinone reductase (Na(+)-transporting) subunit C [Prevotellaceae bacterium]|jgi:Na+-transporting NADH:ubiquinone oxidoreductase subunit C|nr:NADH:ubiquinone reductase (Na(+)-transporting) subunit C [Prevotellaceae bacterium]